MFLKYSVRHRHHCCAQLRVSGGGLDLDRSLLYDVASMRRGILDVLDDDDTEEGGPSATLSRLPTLI